MPASHQIRVSHPGIGSFSPPYQQAMHFLSLKKASLSAAAKWYHNYNRQKIQQATKAKSSATTELTRIIDNHIKALNDLILEKFEIYINDIDIGALRHNIPSGSILNHLRSSGQFQIIKKAIPDLLNEYNSILSSIRATTNYTLKSALKRAYDCDSVQQIKEHYINGVIRKLQSYFDYPDGTNGKLPTSQISCNASVIRIADDIAEEIRSSIDIEEETAPAAMDLSFDDESESKTNPEDEEEKPSKTESMMFQLQKFIETQNLLMMQQQAQISHLIRSNTEMQKEFAELKRSSQKQHEDRSFPELMAPFEEDVAHNPMSLGKEYPLSPLSHTSFEKFDNQSKQEETASLPRYASPLETIHSPMSHSYSHDMLGQLFGKASFSADNPSLIQTESSQTQLSILSPREQLEIDQWKAEDFRRTQMHYMKKHKLHQDVDDIQSILKESTSPCIPNTGPHLARAASSESQMSVIFPDEQAEIALFKARAFKAREKRYAKKHKLYHEEDHMEAQLKFLARSSAHNAAHVDEEDASPDLPGEPAFVRGASTETQESILSPQEQQEVELWKQQHLSNIDEVQLTGDLQSVATDDVLVTDV